MGLKNKSPGVWAQVNLFFYVFLRDEPLVTYFYFLKNKIKTNNILSAFLWILPPN